MDYIALSQEYLANAESLQNTINKLEIKRDKCRNTADRMELNEKILKYRSIRYEMLKTAALLKSRGKNRNDV